MPNSDKCSGLASFGGSRFPWELQGKGSYFPLLQGLRALAFRIQGISKIDVLRFRGWGFMALGPFGFLVEGYIIISYVESLSWKDGCS